METVIGGKGIEITPALRSFTENKLKKLDRVFNGVMDVHVTLSVQKYLQIADLTVKTRSGGFSATAQTTERQKKRIKSRKGPKRGEKTGAWQAPEEPLPEGVRSEAEPRLRRERLPVKPMSVEEAMLQVRAADEGFIVFRNAVSEELNVIYRRKDGDIGLIEPK